MPWGDAQIQRFKDRFPGSTVPLKGDVLPDYFVPAGALGFSVVVFIVCALLCFICLLVRRKVLGGELGGSPTGRLASCVFLCLLWAVYVIFSIMQTKGWAFKNANKTFGGDEQTFSPSVKYWLT